MDQVPKVLKPMVQQWAPEGFVVSFKLETDMQLLFPKAANALDRYGHQIVIANDLHTRKDKVCFVTKRKGSQLDRSIEERFEAKWLELTKGATNTQGQPKEIEEDIVAELLQQHARWIGEAQ